MATATTPKGRTVTVETVTYGTRNEGGTVFYGGIKVAVWTQIGAGSNHSIEDALKAADDKIDHNGLSDDTSTMAIREIPEALRLMFRGKALQEGKTMQAKIIELMQAYVSQGG
jgi:hypothetical protein